MVNYAETASIRTNVSLSSAPTIFDDLVPLRIGFYACMVPSMLKDGYLAACKVYADMEEQAACGAYFLLTGSQYARLAKQYIPGNLSSVDKQQWQRGFVAGWNACTFGFEEQAHEAE